MWCWEIFCVRIVTDVENVCQMSSYLEKLAAGIGNFLSPTKHRSVTSDNEDSEYLPSTGSDSADSTGVLVYALIYILIMRSHISLYICTLMRVSNSYCRRACQSCVHFMQYMIACPC